MQIGPIWPMSTPSAQSSSSGIRCAAACDAGIDVSSVCRQLPHTRAPMSRLSDELSTTTPAAR